jgi:hypothetical protein
VNYEVLDTERGDVLAVYTSRVDAVTALRGYLKENPELVPDMAMASVNGTGLPTEVVPAKDLLAP